MPTSTNEVIEDMLSDPTRPLSDFDVSTLESIYPDKAQDIWLNWLETVNDDLEAVILRGDKMARWQLRMNLLAYKQEAWEKLREKGVL